MSKTYTATLTRIKNGVALRTDSVEGQFVEMPTPGEAFLFIAEPLDPEKDARLIRTSLVKEFMGMPDGGLEFQTLNSTYRLSDIQELN